MAIYSLLTIIITILTSYVFVNCAIYSTWDYRAVTFIVAGGAGWVLYDPRLIILLTTDLHSIYAIMFI